MFEFGQFIEIQTVGVLFLFAFSPVLLLMRKTSRGTGTERWFGWSSDSHVRAGAVVVIAFALGVMTNRLVDDFVSNALHLSGRESVDSSFNAAHSVALAQRGSDSSLSHTRGDALPKTLRIAEYSVDKDSPMATYTERHRSFMRLLRGAAVASVAFMIAVTFRLGFPESGKPKENTYPIADIVGAGVLAILFTLAYFSESQHYYLRVCEMALQTECKLQPGDYSAPHLTLAHLRVFAWEGAVCIVATAVQLVVRRHREYRMRRPRRNQAPPFRRHGALAALKGDQTRAAE